MSGPGNETVEQPMTAIGPQAVDTPEVKADLPRYSLPPLDNGAKCFYDTEAKSMWVGIPIGLSLDPVAAAFFLDAAKLEFLKHYQREMPAIVKAAQTRQSLTGKVKEGFGAMMHRLGAGGKA
jgi:hypothetical protein